MNKLTKNELNILLYTMDNNEKAILIDNFSQERNRLMKKFSKLEIGYIDDSFSRFPYASLGKNGKVIVNSNRLDREIYLGMVK